jgi:UTP--glucose-1-phosphate uridylyltransferase
MNASPRVSTGIIAAAGSASRMWPASKVFPKELFPLGRLPALGYVVWEMVEAGLEHIIIVVREGGLEPVRAFLDPDIAPPSSVASDGIVKGFTEMLRRSKFTLVEQKGPYGNGTPLLNGSAVAPGETCLFAFADDVVFGENASAGLVSTFQKCGCPVLCVQPVAKEDASKFGILEVDARGRIPLVTRFVEKPKPGETSSTLASLGRYLVTPAVVDVLRTVPLGRGDELWLADAFIDILDSGGQIAASELKSGRWYTVGNPDGFRDAVAASAQLEDSGVYSTPGD